MFIVNSSNDGPSFEKAIKKLIETSVVLLKTYPRTNAVDLSKFSSSNFFIAESDNSIPVEIDVDIFDVIFDSCNVLISVSSNEPFFIVKDNESLLIDGGAQIDTSISLDKLYKHGFSKKAARELFASGGAF